MARLYWASLDRAPDAAGLASWAGAVQGGVTLIQAAASFVGSSEFQGRYGALNDSQFVNQLYLNVLARPADAGGLNAWVSFLNGDASKRADVTVGFSESDEFKTRTVPLMARGVTVSDVPAATTGTAGSDTLNGTAADDIFAAGLGNDSMTGGAGADRFVFNTALNAATNVDTIMDFTPGADTLVLDHHIFTALAIGALPAGSLVSGSNPVPVSASSFILYNSASGMLSYDADGTGGLASTAFATLAGAPNLTLTDFLVA